MFTRTKKKGWTFRLAIVLSVPGLICLIAAVASFIDELIHPLQANNALGGIIASLVLMALPWLVTETVLWITEKSPKK